MEITAIELAFYLLGNFAFGTAIGTAIGVAVTIVYFGKEMK